MREGEGCAEAATGGGRAFVCWRCLKVFRQVMCIQLSRAGVLTYGALPLFLTWLELRSSCWYRKTNQ